jgi:hypothetical protein
VKFETHALFFSPHQLSKNPGEGHQRRTDLFITISVKFIVLQLLLLGVKFVFSLIVSFLLLFVLIAMKGCIVCVTFASASLVFIHIRKIIRKTSIVLY